MQSQRDDRVPVWLAISEFYLDTELRDDDFDRLAHVLARSPYDLDELKAIERFEVGPVLWGNLIDVAGEWQPWDPETLFPLCAEKASLGRGWSRRLATASMCPLLRFFTKRHWDVVAPRVAKMRTAA